MATTDGRRVRPLTDRGCLKGVSLVLAMRSGCCHTGRRNRHGCGGALRFGSMRLLATCLFVAAVIAFVAPAAAHACTFSGPQPLQIDPGLKATDRQPPSLTTVSVVGVKRGQGPQASGCGQTASSCDDLGQIRIAVAGTDDMTPAEQLGFRVSIAAGKPPAGLIVPDSAVTIDGGPTGDGELLLLWTDGNTDDQESLDFTVNVVAVDRAGNESAPKTLRVADQGSGCNLASRSRRAGVGVLVFVLLALAARASRLRRPV